MQDKDFDILQRRWDDYLDIHALEKVTDPTLKQTWESYLAELKRRIPDMKTYNVIINFLDKEKAELRQRIEKLKTYTNNNAAKKEAKRLLSNLKHIDIRKKRYKMYVLPDLPLKKPLVPVVVTFTHPWLNSVEDVAVRFQAALQSAGLSVDRALEDWALIQLQTLLNQSPVFPTPNDTALYIPVADTFEKSVQVWEYFFDDIQNRLRMREIPTTTKRRSSLPSSSSSSLSPSSSEEKERPRKTPNRTQQIIGILGGYKTLVNSIAKVLGDGATLDEAYEKADALESWLKYRWFGKSENVRLPTAWDIERGLNATERIPWPGWTKVLEPLINHPLGAQCVVCSSPMPLFCCGICAQVSYCGQKCADLDWDQHKCE